MTERKGGSDVGITLKANTQLTLATLGSGTETMAVEQPDGTHKLYGYKWFSSATDSDMALTLARVVAPDGTVTQVINFHALLLHKRNCYQLGLARSVHVFLARSRRRWRTKWNSSSTPERQIRNSATAHRRAAIGWG